MTHTDPTALALLRDAESYLSALHTHVARHDNIGADLTCGGCLLRDRIAAALPQLAAAPAASLPPADRAAAERRLTVQQADALWDALAAPGTRSAAFPEQHGRVCAAVADIISEVTAGQAPTDQAGLRDRIADEVRRLHNTGAVYALDAGEPERIADAVVAVLPTPDNQAAKPARSRTARFLDALTHSGPGYDTSPPADRAAVLLEAANALAALGLEDSLVSGPRAWAEAIEVLRRLAGGARQDGVQP